MSAVLQEQLSGSPESLGAMIARLVEIRDRRREIAAEDSMLVEQWDEIKKIVLQRMEEEGSNQVGSKEAGATVTLTESVVPQVVDREAAEKWILETGNLYMLQFRIATGAFRELIESGQEVPGIEKFIKKDISLRSK